MEDENNIQIAQTSGIENNATAGDAETGTKDLDKTTELSSEESADEVNDVEFKDANTNVEDAGDKNKDQDAGKEKDEEMQQRLRTRKQNAEFARARREREQQEQMRKVRFDSIVEATGGVNPFTNEKIEDDADIEEYIAMKKIEKSGGDPIADYHKFVKNQIKEKLNQSNKQPSAIDVNEDMKNFVEKYPKANINQVLDNKEFEDFADGLVGQVPLAIIYAKFLLAQKKSEETAKKFAEDTQKKTYSAVGSLSTPYEKPQPIELDNLSDEQFDSMIEKVKTGEIKLKR